MFRTLIRVALVVAVLFASLISAPPAEAAKLSGCDKLYGSYHYYAYLRSDSTTFYGMYGTWNRATMSISGASSSNGRLMTSEMWVANGKDWAEAGLMQGYRGSAVGYYVFRGWADANGSYKELTLSKVTQSAGVTDEYQISRSGTTNKWWIYWNGSRVETGNTGFWSTQDIEMGGEAQSESATPAATAGAFTMCGKGITSGGGQANFTKQSNSVASGMTGSSPATSAWKWSIS